MSLMEPLAIRLGGQTALHGHSAKSPKNGDISRWSTPAKSLVMPRYSEYKPSGVEWLGDVPGHWEVSSFRHCLSQMFNGLTANQVDEADNAVPVTRIETISYGVIDESKLGFISSDEAREDRALIPGDILFSNINSLNMVGKCAFYPGGRTIYAGMNLLVLRPAAAKCLPLWLCWLVRSTSFRCVVESLAKPAINQASVSQSSINSITVAVPPLPEQTQIAAFLDRETGKIDALIAEQRRLVELLAEKRQAVISHAVTKGLNPARHSRAGGNPAEKIDPRSGQNSCPAPQEFSNQLDSRLRGNDGVVMKDSGIEWLGEVPEHWEVFTVRRIAKSVQTGGTPSIVLPSEELENGFVWFTPGDFEQSLRLVDSARKTTAEAVKLGDAKCFPAGSVLIVSIGATLGKIGFAEFPSSANQQINAVIPNEKMDGYFLTYSLSVKEEVMRFLSNASTIGIMNQEKTKEIWLAVPPLEEQRAIAAFLDTETAKFDTLTAEAQRAIDLLQERRSALISAAVTGKIDVRGIQALPQ